MEITKYKHKPYDWQKLMNKEQFPQTTLAWTDAEEFNEIYKYCKANYIKGVKTKSGGIAGGPKNRYQSFYFTNVTKASIELVIASLFDGCYKIVVKNKKANDNCVSGNKALAILMKLSKEFGVEDIFKNNAVDKDEGAKVKSEIESPMISAAPIYKGREFEHAYHLDLNSSYFSRLCEAYPELSPLGNWLYENRKENNGFFKHLMTNSIGCMQSVYCTDIFSRYKNHKAPYQLAKFSKIAINGTNRIIEDLATKLTLNKFEVLAFNTDGIWYRSKDKSDRAYHDENEGTKLGQWKNDHKNVKLYLKSAGAYQYIEDGKVKTVLRGFCDLDKIKPDRDTWEWHEIDNQCPYTYEFDEERGIITNEED